MTPCIYCRYPTPGPLHSCGTRIKRSRWSGNGNRQRQIDARINGRQAFARFTARMRELAIERGASPTPQKPPSFVKRLPIMMLQTFRGAWSRVSAKG